MVKMSGGNASMYQWKSLYQVNIVNSINILTYIYSICRVQTNI